MRTPRILILQGRPAPALSRAVLRAGGRIGRIVADPSDLAGLSGSEQLVVPAGVDFSGWGVEHDVYVQVTHVSQVAAAIAHGAAGLVVKGHEAGGAVGEESAPILLQRVRAATSLPLWLQGGIGLHTAAAAIALGAEGVVLDHQLSLYPEAPVDPELRDAIRAMDGSETDVIDGVRVYARPGPLHDRRIELGQDAAFARVLSDRFPRIVDLIRGLEREIDAHLGQAYAVQPLAPGHGFAAEHGIRYPIAQGPMTRVSDRADFALAVAEGGGMPFLALSLVRGEALADMLESTRAALGDRPWGAGMLGFAPPALREEQLEAVRRAKPAVALLAGGRPAQARALEEDGIPTYLHVPSPGLLDLFLKDGARRFVFEGRECGGHVGPRTSFVLWEQFVERLLRFESPEELCLLFAGGIHDARSAAAVSAITAPLAVKGARIGVIMGTAYLYTDEAVSTGAITRVFQQEALGCADTRLVHTAPGHATRTASSPFVDAFEARKAELLAQGTPADEMWEELERLNLGRLRIASKGVKREGSALVEVDDDTQRREGMFMIGQVAALRSATTTIGALHHEVSAGASAFLAAPGVPDTTPADIAIIGMAGFFPDAHDIDDFWSHLVLGRDAVREVHRSRWNPDLYFDPEDRGTGRKSVSKWGGFLPPIDFDPLEFGIPPRSLPAIDPVQLLALQAAKHALDDAGYGEGGFDRDRASVIFGAEAGTDLASAYGFRALFPQYLGEVPPELDALLPSLTEDSFPGVLANVIAGRIANRLDLGGVNYTVDAACASSLAAVDLACKELRAGTSDLVLAGGADLHNAVGDYLLFSSVHALSRTGRSRPFDAEADGIALGEAVAVVVCKRLEDAERDGDRVYAVIKGIAGSSDGKSLGLTAPRKEGQKRALTRAYDRAGVAARDIGLAEAHGTGTVVGDRTELATLTEIFTGAGARPGTVTLGSVKSNVGHTKCAAGLAGLIKCALAIHRRVLPPTLHIRRPNPGWNRHTSPFVFRGVAAPWASDHRNAAVSAFGFGGTNFHVVLGSHEGEAPASGLRDWPAELFLIREPADVVRIRKALAAGRRLVDIAASLALRNDGLPAVVVVAESAADLSEKLDRVDRGEEGRGVFPVRPVDGKLVFLFPGQGSQAPGMLAELFVAFPWLQGRLPAGWAERIFPGDAWEPAHRKEQRAGLTDTRVAQPALGIVDLAAAEVLKRLGIQPDLLAGHSYGELVALAFAGALPEEHLLEVSEARGRLILEAAGDDPGTMAAVTADAAAVVKALGGAADVVLANLNSPDQTVISGPTAAIRAAVAKLEGAGLEVKAIPVAAAFHSPVVAGAAAGLSEVLAGVGLRTPDRPVYANRTAQPYGDDVRETLSAQVAEPVRFAESVVQMADDGGTIFVEVGPGRVLTRLVSRILDGRPHLARSLEDKKGGGALSGLVRLVATLVSSGIPIDPTVLFEGRSRPFDLDAAFAPSPTAWKVDGHRAVPVEGTLPDYALQPPPDEPFELTGGGSRDRVVLKYLQTLREQAEAQRRVLLAYLGDAQPAMGELPALLTDVAPLPTEAVPLLNQSPSEILLDVVSERTGYPVEMLDIDLDLEADLSIDSIKRIEILGVVAQRLGVDANEAGGNDVVESLAGVKTLRGIIEWLDKDGPVFARYVSELRVLPTPDRKPLAGRTVCLDPRGTQIGEALQQALRAEGARVTLLDDGTFEDVESVVLFAGLGPDDAVDLGAKLWGLADRSRQALLAGASVLLLVTGGAGLESAVPTRAWSAGVSGLAKSLRKEWPKARVCRVDVDPDGDLPDLCEQVLGELASDGPVEVSWVGDVRSTRAWVPFPVESEPLALSREAVVLLTGGARGITARMAVAFADRFACTVVLVGRSPAPEAEDPALEDLGSPQALRRHLATTGLKPAEIEARVKRILADREMRATFDAIGRTGATLDYRAVDVRDGEAVSALLDDVYAAHGRIDWVVHGAGVNEDRFLKDKTEASFLRVFETKVRGAHHLLAGLRDDVQGIAFFSSVAGAFGNRGQADYAAANDALDQLARTLPNAVSVAWGPWAGGGMVDEALEKQYAELGIGLIQPDAGVDAFFRELTSGAVHAVWMAATPEDMA
ncbi:MAG: SDR family NAD(P)-dependent oxidoreductase [Myxococcota bacterium]